MGWVVQDWPYHVEKERGVESGTNWKNAISPMLSPLSLNSHCNMLNLAGPYTALPRPKANDSLGPSRPKPGTQKDKRDTHMNTSPNFSLCHICPLCLMREFSS